MNKETKYFLLWLLDKNNLIKTILWALNKLYHKFIRINNSYKYPNEIHSIVKKLTKPTLVNNSKDTKKFIFKIDQINLASRNLDIRLNTIDWLKDFKDPEDIESIHRWNWMIYEISKKNNQISLEELIFYQRSWYNQFINEIDNQNCKKYLRWSSYSIAERISNSILVFNYFNEEIPFDILNCLNQQVYYLTRNLEYFDVYTGNHIINNARALYLYSIHTRDNNIQNLAKTIFYDQLNRMITKDGFLREGSSHYHFLFLRWLVEVFYFSVQFGDNSFSKYLKTHIFNLAKNSLHFLYKNKDEVFSISLFGDISPDFPPEWLASLICSDIMPFNIELLPKSKLPVYSWNNLWKNTKTSTQ